MPPKVPKTRRLHFSKRIQQRGGGYEDRPVILLSCPEFNAVADDIISTSKVKGGSFIKGNITWKTFNDRTPDVKFDKATVLELNTAKVVFLANFSFLGDTSNYKDKVRDGAAVATPVLDQLMVLNSLAHYGVSDISIVLPYFPVGTMERIVNEGEIPTAFALAQIINTIPNGTTKNKLYIFDIHALPARFFFHTNTNPILISMMETYMKHIAENFKDENNFIVFPDDGAKKRFDSMLIPGMQKIVCSKVRLGDKRITTVEKDYSYDDLKKATGVINLFLIDDLVQSGGTINEAFRGVLSTEGLLASTINCYPMITHSVFPEGQHATFFDAKRIDGSTPIITKLITTNTNPIMARTLLEKYSDKVTVLQINDMLCEILTNPAHTHGASFATK
jgi:phosphoribosylpyrophosphate synthetase